MVSLRKYIMNMDFFFFCQFLYKAEEPTLLFSFYKTLSRVSWPCIVGDNGLSWTVSTRATCVFVFSSWVLSTVNLIVFSWVERIKDRVFLSCGFTII